MTYPDDVMYRFQNTEDSDGSITFCVCSKDTSFLNHLIQSIYLELSKTDYDMEGIVLEKNLFRETRKILIKKILSKEVLKEE